MLKLTFLGRVANRWRIRVDLPPGTALRGLTVGLWREDGLPLAPSVVAPGSIEGSYEAEIGGPCSLPAGAEVRCIADVDGAAPVTASIGLDRRHGLHAFLHADRRISPEPLPRGAALTRGELRRLSAAFPWVAASSGVETLPAGPSGDLLDMLARDFGVDVGDIDEELLASMRRGE